MTHNNLQKNVVKIVVPLKYLSNFSRSLNMPLINCEVELILTWFKNCVLIRKWRRDAGYEEHINKKTDNPENAIFQITGTKLYVPVVTLSKENDIKLLEQLKTGFKSTIKWNKYRSQMTIQPQNEEETYEKIIDMSNNNDYTTGNILDFAYFKENYKLIRIDLSKQTKLKDQQQINFIGKLENQDHGVTMFFIIEKSEETTFNVSQNSVTII